MKIMVSLTTFITPTPQLFHFYLIFTFFETTFLHLGQKLLFLINASQKFNFSGKLLSFGKEWIVKEFELLVIEVQENDMIDYRDEKNKISKNEKSLKTEGGENEGEEIKKDKEKQVVVLVKIEALMETKHDRIENLPTKGMAFSVPAISKCCSSRSSV